MKTVKVGQFILGDKKEIFVQSMLSTPRHNPDAAVAQALELEKAGCKITVDEIGKEQDFFDGCVKYSPYMRRRLTLLRMNDMIRI